MNNAASQVDIDPFMQFSFTDNLKRIYQNLWPDTNCLPLHNGFFAAPESVFKHADLSSEPVVFQNPVLAKQGIISGKLISQAQAPVALAKMLLDEEVCWISYYLDVVIHAFKPLNTEGVSIDADAVSVSMEQILQGMEEIERMAAVMEDFEDGKPAYLHQIIQNLCGTLAKLAGVHAFFSKSIADMAQTFEFLNQIYLVKRCNSEEEKPLNVTSEDLQCYTNNTLSAQAGTFSIDFQQAHRHFPEGLLDTIDYFRRIALSIAQNPATIAEHVDHLDLKSRYNGHGGDCLSRISLLEALAYGDAGVLLAYPEFSDAGLILADLGNDAQKTQFFDRAEQENASRFLAVSEPHTGTGLGQIQTRLEKLDAEHFALFGQKWLVAHGADAAMGVVIARTSPGPLGMSAVLLTPDSLAEDTGKILRERMNMAGLNGARLSRIVFNGLKIHRDQILGNHLSPMKRGLMGITKCLNRIRPHIGSLALGHAQAVLDYVKTSGALSATLQKQADTLDAEILSARLMLHESAARLDSDAEDSAFAVVINRKAIAIAKKSTHFVVQAFGAACQAHPLLIKWHCDVQGFACLQQG